MPLIIFGNSYLRCKQSQIIHIHPLNPRLTEATAASKDHFGVKVRDIRDCEHKEKLPVNPQYYISHDFRYGSK